MDAHAYPGKGLSLSQLVFALSEELKHAAYSPSFTFDNVSQLDHDISIALANVREWRNSFLRVNRVSLDILSLVPTHLPVQKDRFRASFVCRHWRRIFLQHATLWSKLYLSKGNVYAKTLLERAKGSALDVITNYGYSIDTVRLLPPHNAQIGSLDFGGGHWMDIQKFSEVNSGPLPLLRSLRINAINEFSMDHPDTMTPPTVPLFSSAVNLKEFILHSERSPFLSHFVFPNLTTFELSGMPAQEGFRALDLLNFLEASPMLQTIRMKIIADILLGGVPHEKIVVLPHVETFGLVMDDGGAGYEIAARISCPSAKRTSLMHERDTGIVVPREILPNPISWDAIARQYTRSPVEAVSLKIECTRNARISCSVTFRYPGEAAFTLGFKVAESDEEEDAIQVPFPEMHYEVLSQASRVIRDHPLLVHVKHISISHGVFVHGSNWFTRAADEVGQLFKSVGPLESLTIFQSDLYLYLSPFINDPKFYDTQRPVVSLPIKELNISHPLHLSDNEMRMAGIVELAKSYHAQGIPLERVSVSMERIPAVLAERLRPWVGTVDCREEMEPDWDY